MLKKTPHTNQAIVGQNLVHVAISIYQGSLAKDQEDSSRMELLLQW